MSGKRMRRLLAELAARTAGGLERPAAPEALMRALCDAMAERQGRPLHLYFRPFPDGLGASGLYLDFDGAATIIVEERTTPEHQLLILGHELWHLEQGDHGHLAADAAAAARSFTDDGGGWDGVVAVAARAVSDGGAESAAETFGLLCRGRFGPWLREQGAGEPVGQDTVEGRIASALEPRPRP
ncbi:hypothetical protein [Streptomyces sp. NPDC050560]|uniref:hypothetical protein n=1 Tax=Streptomyces sp. NPDC050560 TaxID=3365630 RepID=UPI00379370B1